MIIKNNIYVITVVIYSTSQALRARYKKDTICNTLYPIGKLTPIECPNENGDTLWVNADELWKHRTYHCHLEIDEKEYYRSPHRYW